MVVWCKEIIRYFILVRLYVPSKCVRSPAMSMHVIFFVAHKNLCSEERIIHPGTERQHVQAIQYIADWGRETIKYFILVNLHVPQKMRYAPSNGHVGIYFVVLLNIITYGSERESSAQEYKQIFSFYNWDCFWLLIHAVYYSFIGWNDQIYYYSKITCSTKNTLSAQQWTCKQLDFV